MLGGTLAERVTPGGVQLRAEPVRVDSADSFRQLMEDELDRSYRLASAILRDTSDAEDAVHDAALAAWRSWSRLREPSSAPAWFRRILINTCRDRLRRRGRRSVLEIVRPVGAHEHPAAHDALENVAERDLLRGALNRLSPDERIAVTLRYAEDLTVPAIAEALSIAEGTVKSRLHNAVSKLRAALNENPK